MQLEEAAVRQFLACSMVAQIAVRSRQGEPHLTPLWFVRHGGRICLATGGKTPAARSLTAPSAVVLLFYGERARNRGGALRVHGRGRIIHGVPWPIRLRIAAKYYLSSPTRGLLPLFSRLRLLKGYYARGGTAVVIDVVPETAEFIPLP